MSPLSYLRSVTALATRGGRGLLSRRNFSSSAGREETKGVDDNNFAFVGYLTTGYLAYVAWEYLKTDYAIAKVRSQARLDRDLDRLSISGGNDSSLQKKKVDSELQGKKRSIESG